MAVTIQVKRGNNASVPALATGEFGLATDTNNLYIGGSSENLQIAMLGSSGQLPASQIPALPYDPAGAAQVVQTNLTDHVNDKNNPHEVTASQAGADPAGTADSVVGTHNLSSTAHSDIRSDIEDITPIAGSSAPTATTQGTIGQLYVDNTHDKLYYLNDGGGASNNEWVEIMNTAPVAVLSYVGTGTTSYTLNLPFTPQFVAFIGAGSGRFAPYSININRAKQVTILPFANILNGTITNTCYIGDGDGNTGLNLTATNNSITWAAYDEEDPSKVRASDAKNSSGATYYVLIGGRI